jgi:hypothetical protein
MKITVEHEIPDRKCCIGCEKRTIQGICLLFLERTEYDTPCPACMEARKEAKKG